MKIAVLAANGRVGRLVVEEAVKRNHDVTAFIKGENKTVATKSVSKDLYDLTKEDLEGYDVVVDAVGGWDEKTIPNIPNIAIKVADLLTGSKTRLYVVGGAGSLFINKEHTVTVDMGPSFPDAFKPLSNAHGKALAYLRKTTDLDWVYISPAGDFQAEGAKTGKYILGGEELVLNSKGESVMSYADYAIAMVDIIEQGNHLRERISLVSE